MSFYMHSDQNCKEIVKGLRKCGAVVLYLKAVSRTKGVPDLIVLYGGVTHLIEVKNVKGELSKEQIAWHATAAGVGGPIATIRTLDEAKVALGITA